jgi:hypothetical protein
MTIQGVSVTTAAASEADIVVSGDTLDEGPLSCLAAPGCKGTLSGAATLSSQTSIPLDYVSPLVGNNLYVSYLRVEDPPSFARTAFRRLHCRLIVAFIAGLQTRFIFCDSQASDQGLPSSGTSAALLSSPIRICAITLPGARPSGDSALVAHVTMVVRVVGSYPTNVLKPEISPVCP